MKSLDSLPLPTLLRYGLTGVVSVLLFTVVPWVLYKPSAAMDLATPGSMAALTTLGFILGFVLDALKPYQWSPGYVLLKMITTTV